MVLSTFPSLNLETLTNREYSQFFEQAFNMTNFRLNGKIELQNESDKQKDIKEEFEDLGGEEWLNN